jgi:hypothetical protein
LRDHVSVAILIMMSLLIGFMRCAIAFNDQLRLATVEVSNVVAKLMLAPEFESEQLPIPKECP